LKRACERQIDMMIPNLNNEYWDSPLQYIGASGCSCILLSVIVPVLSEHRIAIPAMSSMALSRVTIAPWWESSLEPRASVVVVTISMASGIEATMSTTVKESASTTEVMCARCRYTTEHSTRDTTTSTIMMSISMFCKLLTSPSFC